MKRLKIKDRNSPYWTPARLAYHRSQIGRRKSKPITAADIERNCADCPKPVRRESNVLGAALAIFALGTVLVFAAFSASGTADRSLELESCVRRQMYESGLPYTEANWSAFAANC